MLQAFLSSLAYISLRAVGPFALSESQQIYQP